MSLLFKSIFSNYSLISSLFNFCYLPSAHLSTKNQLIYKILALILTRTKKSTSTQHLKFSASAPCKTIEQQNFHPTANKNFHRRRLVCGEFPRRVGQDQQQQVEQNEARALREVLPRVGPSRLPLPGGGGGGSSCTHAPLFCVVSSFFLERCRHHSRLNTGLSGEKR